MNHDKYRYTRYWDDKGNPWHLDDLHIDVLHKLALASPRGSTICEIGCCRGASTSGFVEALEQREDLRLLLFDPDETPQLRRLLAESPARDRITFYQEPAWARLRQACQLIFIDGHHGWPALADLALALTLGCDTIVLHDTQATGPRAKKLHHGSILAATLLRNATERRSWEDADKRPNQRTHRGLLVSFPHRQERVKEHWAWSALH